MAILLLIRCRGKFLHNASTNQHFWALQELKSFLQIFSIRLESQEARCEGERWLNGQRFVTGWLVGQRGQELAGRPSPFLAGVWLTEAKFTN